jgi:flagellar basal-body rod protein FlgG
MMRSLWISKTGMEAQQTQLDTISNNLANVSTNGYKRSHAVFEDLMYQNMRQAGAASSDQTELPTGLQVGLGTRGGRDGAQLQPGQPAAERQPARRRDPRQRLLPDPAPRRHDRLHARRLVPGLGDRPARHQHRLHGAARHHDPGDCAERDDRQRRHGERRPAGAGAAAAGRPDPDRELRQPGRARAEGTEPVRRDRGVGTPNTGVPGLNGLGTVQQGFVETSNVNVVEELVQMIQTQRAYELNSKAIQTSDQMLQKLAQL